MVSLGLVTLRHTGTGTKNFETSVNVPEQLSTFKVHMTRKIKNISANNEVMQLKVTIFDSTRQNTWSYLRSIRAATNGNI